MIRWFKRQKRITKFAIGCPAAFVLTCFIGFVVLVIIFIINPPPPTHTTGTTNAITARPTPVPTHTPTKTPVRPTPTVVPTTHPTAAPTAHPTQPIAAVSGPTTIGQPLSHFIAKYGAPNDHTDAKNGAYHFQQYGNSAIDFLIVQTDILDSGAYAQTVESFNAQAPEAGWSSTVTDSICNGFLPSDAVYKSQVQLTIGNAYDKIYYSASLVSQFPASAFTDADQNQVQAGLFDVQYLVNSDSTINTCSIQIGTQQTK
jgi:hypothetical protein